MNKLVDDNMQSNDCNERTCPIRWALSLFDGKYTILIFRELLSGKCRFSDFLKSIKGISSKTLNERLKFLKDNGIVTRQAYPEIPPKVEYSLTEKGRRIEGIISSLKHFGEAMDEFKAETKDATPLPVEKPLPRASEYYPDLATPRISKSAEPY